jgi:uncharacterized protein YbaR (Trm112 family)
MTEDNEPSQTLKDLHTLLMETSVQSGKLVCGSCEHEYAVKEGIANFLLPSHMVWKIWRGFLPRRADHLFHPHQPGEGKKQKGQHRSLQLGKVSGAG